MLKIFVFIPLILFWACSQKQEDAIKITETLYDTKHRIQKQTKEGAYYKNQKLPYKEISYFDTLGRVIRQNYIIGNEKTVDIYQHGDSSIIWTRYLLDTALNLNDTIFPVSNTKIIYLKEQRWQKSNSLLIYEYTERRENGKIDCEESRYNPETGNYFKSSNCH